MVKIINRIVKNEQKLAIWKQLGLYASIYHQIDQIDIPSIQQKEFHKNWEDQLSYNINELTANDSLLEKGIFSIIHHKRIKQFLFTLKGKNFNFGLVHRDLCPRNVILNDSKIYLIDWEMASISIIPHMEIGVILIEKMANKSDFAEFLKGLGISKTTFKKMEKEISILNLVDRLDKYRWASGKGITHKNNYIGKLQQAYLKVINLEDPM